eukprot:3774882-Prymnesium_polylepis.1
MQAAGAKASGGACRDRMEHRVLLWDMPLCFGSEVGAFAFASSAVGGPQAHSELQAAKPLKVAGGG